MSEWVAVIGLVVSAVALAVSIVAGFRIFDRSHWNSAKGVVFWLRHDSLVTSKGTAAIVSNASTIHSLSNVECYFTPARGEPVLFASGGFIPPQQQASLDITSAATTFPRLGKDDHLQVLQNENLTLRFSTSQNHRWEKSLDGACRRVRQK